MCKILWSACPTLKLQKASISCISPMPTRWCQTLIYTSVCNVHFNFQTLHCIWFTGLTLLFFFKSQKCFLKIVVLLEKSEFIVANTNTNTDLLCTIMYTLHKLTVCICIEDLQHIPLNNLTHSIYVAIKGPHYIFISHSST